MAGKTMERRAFEMSRVEVRAEGKKRVLGGYAAVFDRKSVMLWDFKEIIKAGAFAGSLQDDVRALWQHDSSQVLGRARAGTLSIWEDDTGLGFEIEAPDTQAGRDAVTLIERGDVDQMSFGFIVLPDGVGWKEDEDGTLLRVVTRAKLIEISPVTFPAYPDTSAEVVRSAPGWVMERLAEGGTDQTDGGRCADGVHIAEKAAGVSPAERLAVAGATAARRTALRRKDIELLELDSH